MNEGINRVSAERGRDGWLLVWREWRGTVNPGSGPRPVVSFPLTSPLGPNSTRHTLPRLLTLPPLPFIRKSTPLKGNTHIPSSLCFTVPSTATSFSKRVSEIIKWSFTRYFKDGLNDFFGPVLDVILRVQMNECKRMCSTCCEDVIMNWTRWKQLPYLKRVD